MVANVLSRVGESPVPAGAGQRGSRRCGPGAGLRSGVLPAGAAPQLATSSLSWSRPLIVCSAPSTPDILTARADLAYWAGEAGDPAKARDVFVGLCPALGRAFLVCKVLRCDLGRPLPEILQKKSGYAGRSLMSAVSPVMAPFRITAETRRRPPTSSSGFPSTRSRSASWPARRRPLCLPSPELWAARPGSGQRVGGQTPPATRSATASGRTVCGFRGLMPPSLPETSRTPPRASGPHGPAAPPTSRRLSAYPLTCRGRYGNVQRRRGTRRTSGRGMGSAREGGLHACDIRDGEGRLSLWPGDRDLRAGPHARLSACTCCG